MPIHNPVRNLQRWRQVQSILLRYGFDVLIDQGEIKEARRFLHEKLHLSLGEFNDRSMPERVRLMLQELGPTYVKLGQMLSSRSDLMPEAWVQELSKLQDDVPPFSKEQMRQVIQEELGAPPEEMFAWFDPVPVAAASIGQVHRALLADEQSVVIKVQRPDIGPQIRADMEILREIARVIEARTALGRHYGVQGIVEEFARSLDEELDYRNEGRNAERLRRNMASINEVHVPFIYWRLTTARVLTMEWVQGNKITDLKALSLAGLDRQALADTFIRSMLKQVLIDGFFHADPHPANIFVDPDSGALVFIDLGMMGQIVEEQRTELGNMVLAIKRQDSQEIVRVALTIGTAYGPVQEIKLRRELDRLLDRYLTVTLSEVSFAQLINEVLTLLFAHHIRLPHELTLGAKALVQAEEIARTLDPEIQIIEVARAVAQQIIWQRLDPRNFVLRLPQNARETMRLMHALPEAAEQLLKQIQRGKLTVELEAPDLSERAHDFYVVANQLTLALVLLGMTIGSAIAMSASPETPWGFIRVLGVVGFILAMGIGTALVWRVLRALWRAR
jgi:ubiquinone biosynthesis protein